MIPSNKILNYFVVYRLFYETLFMFRSIRQLQK